MRLGSPHKSCSCTRGFTLVEAVMGVLALALFVGACFSAVVFNRVASMKAKEEAIAMDFLIHYVETVRALPFTSITPGFPINPLLDGNGGAPLITIPTSSSWIPINNTNYQTFHPDLVWFQNRNPKLRVVYAANASGGQIHDKHLNVAVAWDAPLGHGGRLQAQVDTLRAKDL